MPKALDRWWPRVAIALWVLLTIASLGRALFLSDLQRHIGIYPIFEQAGRSWCHSEALYTPGQQLTVFRASPLVAALLAPLSLLPTATGSAVLRLMNVAVFAWGLMALARDVFPVRLARHEIAVLFVLALPLSFQALGDVQTTGIVAGALMLGVAAAARSRPLVSAVCIIGAAIVKLYPLSLGMLLCLWRPRTMLLALATASAVALVLPFALQRPTYVAEQYHLWLEHGLNERHGAVSEDNPLVGVAASPFKDIRVPLRLVGLNLSDSAYRALEIAAGAAVAGLSLLARRRYNGAMGERTALLTTFGLATLWMTIFGPATESQTYILVAPIAAILLLAVLMRPRFCIVHVLTVIGFVLLTVSQIVLWFPFGSSVNSLGLHGIGGLSLLAALVIPLFAPPPPTTSQQTSSDPPGILRNAKPSRAHKLSAVSIIVPTYQEAANIPELVERIEIALKDCVPAFEVILVDDDSRDDTERVVNGLGLAWVRLEVRRGVRGLSSAVLHGLHLARYDALVVMDADLSHPPEAIPLLVRELDEGADFVIGSRYVRGGSTDAAWGVFRAINSRAATALARPFSTVRDPMSGFFVISRRSWASAGHLNPIGYKIGLELIVKCRCRDVREVPIHFADRRRGESKLRLSEQVRYLRHIGRLWLFSFGLHRR